MKKLVVTMLAALLALMICMAALADSDASGLYDAAVRLLFRTKNVTLKAKTEFSLDGEWFKTAEGTWMQDGERSFRQLILRAPKWDGTERVNGYTIVMAGNDWSIGNNYYLIEEFNPTYYKSGTAAPRDSILRRTIETEQLISLGSALASQADLLLGEGAVTKTAGRSGYADHRRPRHARHRQDFPHTDAPRGERGSDAGHLRILGVQRLRPGLLRQHGHDGDRPAGNLSAHGAQLSERHGLRYGGERLRRDGQRLRRAGCGHDRMERERAGRLVRRLRRGDDPRARGSERRRQAPTA